TLVRCSLSCSCDLRDLHSFPTRRSSDLWLKLKPIKQRWNLNHSIQEPCCTLEFKKEDQLRLIAYWQSLDLKEQMSPVFCLVGSRSEEHTSELQSRENLVCRLLLEKKKKK